MIRGWVISKLVPPHYTAAVLDDFPVQYGPTGPALGAVDIAQRWGDDEWVTGQLTRYALEVVTDGVQGWDEMFLADPAQTPLVGVLSCLVPDTTILVAIHTSGNSRVAAAVDADTGDPILYNGELWGPDDPISDTRWTPLRNGLVALGAIAADIDAFRTANPQCSPRLLYGWLKNAIIQSSP